MKYDVFISYAPKNIEMAKRVKQYLDAKGLKCWFDSESTHEKEAIISAIEASQIMLVLVSSRSDESHNLEREIILADVEGLAVLPVRIQDVSVQGLLRYLLADSQWIEVANDEINSQQLDLIAETIQSLKSKALIKGTKTVPSSTEMIKRNKLEKLPLDIIKDCTLDELKLLSEIIPERTVSLWKLGIKVHEVLIQKCQDSDKASFLTKLAIHRHRGDSQNKEALEQALNEIEEAIILLRKKSKVSTSNELYAALSKSHREASWILDDLRILSGDPSLIEHSCKHDLLGALAAAGQYPDKPESITGQVTDIDTVLNAPPLEDRKCMLEYANCFNNLTIRLRYINNLSLASKVIEQAVYIGKKLADLDWILYAPDLARYLNNLAQCQADLNETDQAIQNVTESIDIRREFSTKNPDQYAHPLLLSLETKRLLLLRKMDLTGIYQVLEEIVSVLIVLSEKDSAKFCLQVFVNCQDIGYFCFHEGEPKRGFEYMQKGLAAFRDLTPHDQGIYFKDLLGMYHNTVYFCHELEQYPEAISCLEVLYNLLLEKQKTHPDLYLQDLMRTARKLSYYFEITGKPESAEKWKSLFYDHAANCEDFDHTRIGMYEHARSEYLKENQKTEEALQAMQIALCFFRKALKKCNPDKNMSVFAMRSGDLSSALVNLGCWQDDLPLLKEAEDIIRKALDCFRPESRGEMYTYGALCHNLGHALYRHGEIEQTLPLVREGITFLEKSIDTFQNPPEGDSWDKPVDETQKLLNEALEVQKKLSTVDFL